MSAGSRGVMEPHPAAGRGPGGGPTASFGAMRFRVRAAAAATALLLVAAACGDSGGGDSAAPDITLGPAASTTPPTLGTPTVLAIVSPATGDVVAGNVVRLDVTSSGITIVPADGNTSPRSGHYHVFVDRDPIDPGNVIPVAADIIHTTDDPIVIPGLRVGLHRVTVAYGDGTHRRLGFTEAATSFTVAGPSVDASTPPNATAGQPVVITVAVEGLTLPDAGRLYVLVDAAPGPPGEPLADTVLQASETTIAVADLAPGAHTLWIVAGTADRVPLDPPVMDRVTVTVG